MRRNTLRFAALLLAGVFCALILFTGLLVDHDCASADCMVCALLEHNLKVFSAAVLLAAVLACLFSHLTVREDTSASDSARSLFTPLFSLKTALLD